MGVDFYIPREFNINTQKKSEKKSEKIFFENSESKKFLVLLSNNKNLPHSEIKILLGNIFKFLKIPLEACLVAWKITPDESMESMNNTASLGAIFFHADPENFTHLTGIKISSNLYSLAELIRVIHYDFLLNFGVNLREDLSVGLNLLANLSTLDLSEVILQPLLKRKVFEDVSRLSFSSSSST